MSVQLRVDPRTAKTFADLGLPGSLLAKIGQKYSNPLSIQKKILALNSSGCSVFARSMPNSGKSTAAILSMLSTPVVPLPSLTNLILVPTPALADQYYETMQSMSGAENQIKYLYRTGSPELDEQQHQQFKKDQITHTLIGTPHRILDYITASPDILSFENLRQLVIDEVDIFAPSSSPTEKALSEKRVKETPLETLMEYILTQASPVITALMTSASDLNKFQKFPELLKKVSRPMFEVKEPTPEKWNGEVIHMKSETALTSESDYASALKRNFQGPGLIVLPHNLSSAKLESQLGDIEAVVTGPAEVAGLNIDNLERVYILGDHPADDVDRLKWAMTGSSPKLYIISSNSP